MVSETADDKDQPAKAAPARLSLELKRVQTFLFSVPKKRVMEGANVLMGEALRLALSRDYLAGGYWPVPTAAVSPGAKDGAAAASPQDVLSQALATWRAAKPNPSFDSDKFLRDEAGLRYSELLEDDPAYDMARGLIARDGGHFIALFATPEHAQAFAVTAKALIAKMLPGVMLSVEIAQWGPTDWRVAPEIDGPTDSTDLAEALPLDLPPLLRCAETGQDVATRVAHTEDQLGPAKADKPGPQQRVTAAVALRYTHGKHFSRHEPVASDASTALSAGDGRLAEDRLTFDIASLLRPVLPMYDASKFIYPQHFDGLTHGRYMAVMHLDINGMGDLIKAVSRETSPTSFGGWLEQEAKIQLTYGHMRVAVRNAMVEALNSVYCPAGGYDYNSLSQRENWNRIVRFQRPYHLMMVGGDDVLVVCRAADALPLAVAFASALDSQCKQGNALKQAPISAGIGVIISPPSVPFSALHDAAEQLAGSAKAWWRGLRSAKSGGTVIDWAVTTSAWIDDPLGDRRRDQVVAGAAPLVLSGKPYRVLADDYTSDAGKRPSLAQLLDVAMALEKALKPDGKDTDDSRAARSQLKALPAQLRRGMSLGTLAWLALPAGTRDVLVKWDLASNHSPWKTVGQQTLSFVPDAIEVFELKRLGAQSTW